MAVMALERVAVAVVLVSVLVSACSGDDIVVSADPTDLIGSARFVAWEDLSPEAREVLPPTIEGRSEFLGAAVILPGSEPRRLLIAIWHNACQPKVTISAPDSEPRLAVSISAARTGVCGEVLKMWPIEVTLKRDLDPAAVVLVITDARSSHPASFSEVRTTRLGVAAI